MSFLIVLILSSVFHPDRDVAANLRYLDIKILHPFRTTRFFVPYHQDNNRRSSLKMDQWDTLVPAEPDVPASLPAIDAPVPENMALAGATTTTEEPEEAATKLEAPATPTTEQVATAEDSAETKPVSADVTVPKFSEHERMKNMLNSLLFPGKYNGATSGSSEKSGSSRDGKRRLNRNGRGKPQDPVLTHARRLMHQERLNRKALDAALDGSTSDLDGSTSQKKSGSASDNVPTASGSDKNGDLSSSANETTGERNSAGTSGKDASSSYEATMSTNVPEPMMLEPLLKIDLKDLKTFRQEKIAAPSAGDKQQQTSSCDEVAFDPSQCGVTSDDANRNVVNASSGVFNVEGHQQTKPESKSDELKIQRPAYVHQSTFVFSEADVATCALDSDGDDNRHVMLLSCLPTGFAPIVLQNLLFANERVKTDSRLARLVEEACKNDLQAGKLHPQYAEGAQFKKLDAAWNKNLQNLAEVLIPEAPKCVGRRSRRLVNDVYNTREYYNRHGKNYVPKLVRGAWTFLVARNPV